MARWLGVEAVGQLAVINVSVMTIVQLASLGLPSANTYFIAKDARYFRNAAINALLFALLAGTLLGILFSLLAASRPSWFAFVSQDLIRVAAISIPFQLLTLIGLNIFLAMGKIREFNLLDLLSHSLLLLNAIAALIIFRLDLLALVTMNTASSILVTGVIAILLVIAGKSVSNSAWRPDLSLLRRMLGYGIKFHISIVAGTLIFRADLLVVNHFRGSADAGVYSIASQVGMLLMLLPGVIATLLFPRIAGQRDETGETTCRVTRHTAFVMLLCCLAAMPLSLLLPMLYGPSFSDTTIQLWILLPGVYLVGLESVLVQHFNAMGLPRRIPMFWVITLAVNIALVFALADQFGARGAALASTLSYSLIFFLVTHRFLQTSGRSVSDIFVLQGRELRLLLSFRTRAGLMTRGVGR